jgi:hypothetical protein
VRADMSRVIVERPRRGGVHRKGRARSFGDLPLCEGMRRAYRISGGWKELNENLAAQIDDPRAWTEYQRRHPDRRYAVSKRRLGKAELRRYGLRDHAPEDGAIERTRRC